MRILVHTCCGPCAITVLQNLAEAGHELCGFFFNPNIHPLAEYMRRREGAAQVAQRLRIPLLFADSAPEKEQVWTDPWLADTALPRSGQPHPPARPKIGAKPPVNTPSPPPAADPRIWLRAVSGREDKRCLFCWRSRLQKTAETAVAKGFDAFTSSLLYSRYQDHEAIRGLGEDIATETGVVFAYQDFRPLWQEGIRISKEWGIYRQQYCGCLFSEYDRYRNEFQRLRSEKEER